MAIEDKQGFDKRFLSDYIAKRLSKVREEKQILLTDVAAKMGVKYHSTVTSVLNGRMTASVEQLWKIAYGIWVSEKEFDKLVLEAKEAEIEHSHGVRLKVDTWEEPEMNEDFALKSLVGNNPAALEEARNVIKWIKEKHDLR